MGGGQTITLEFLAAQQDRILGELAEMRDDIRIIAAMMQRMDGTVSGLIWDNPV
jgi:hypothetical protein